MIPLPLSSSWTGTLAKSRAQKIAEQVIKANGGKKVKKTKRTFDMTRAVKDLKKRKQ
jgi:hypothetical protein